MGLPKAGDGSPELVTRPTLREPRLSLRVLLAEDNEVNRRLAMRIMTRHGYSVRAVVNGREALELLSKEHFDLIVMDIKMPEMDGFTATKAIREKELLTGGHIPIVAMTALALKGDKERCLQAGMDAYISKPFHVQELFKVIEEMMKEP